MAKQSHDRKRPPVRKRWGQHFLSDPLAVRRIIAAVNPQPEDKFLEVGPGHGELTLPLAAASTAVIAVDIDPLLIAALEEELPGHVQLLQGDILKADLPALLPAGVRVVGSLPFNISSQILMRLLEHRERWRDGHFILQKEMADRLVAPPGNRTYGRLSVMAQAFAAATRLLDLPPTVFSPRPKVSSTLVRLVPRPTDPPLEDPKLFAAVVRAAFGQRRKKLSNALKALGAGPELAQAGLENLRAEHVAVIDYIRLSNALSSKGGIDLP